MAIAVRPARLDDIDGLIVLLTSLFAIEEDFVTDSAKQRAGLSLIIESSKDSVLVAESEGQVVGMCSVQTLISTAEGGPVGLLEDMVVAEDHRGKGIGHTLLAAAEQWAANQGLLRLQLLADRNNRPALDFYRQQQWLQTQLVALRKG